MPHLQKLVPAAALLALAACGSSGQNNTGADTTAVQAAPVTAPPATPPTSPSGADTAMSGHNIGSDTLVQDTMKKDSTGM